MAEVDERAAIATSARTPNALTAAEQTRKVVGHLIAFDERKQRLSVYERRCDIIAHFRERLDPFNECAFVLRIKVRKRRKSLPKCRHRAKRGESNGGDSDDGSRTHVGIFPCAVNAQGRPYFDSV
jgi:hypothetical protein